MDRYNWAVYEVMPAEFDNSKAKYPTAEDGRALRHCGSYLGTPEAAIRKACRMLEDDAVESVADARELADMLSAYERAVSDLADRIGEDARRLEAAS